MRTLLILLNLCLSISLWAQETPTKTRSEREVVNEYFTPRKKNRPRASVDASERRPSSGGPRYLAIQGGAFFSDETYKWNGTADRKNRGTWLMNVSYRLGEWVNSMDLLMRFELMNYNFDERDPQKLSFQAMVTFPDANSEFPLYFGAGAGLGAFVRQTDGESSVSFDYQIMVGLRFFDLFDSMGFVAEVGAKNHLHLFSDGQSNGLAFTMGPVFQF